MAQDTEAPTNTPAHNCIADYGAYLAEQEAAAPPKKGKTTDTTTQPAPDAADPE